jgi:hypothetical protein
MHLTADRSGLPSWPGGLHQRATVTWHPKSRIASWRREASMQFVADVARLQVQARTRTTRVPFLPPLLELQRSAGNSAVTALLQRRAIGGALQRRRAAPTVEKASSDEQADFDEAPHVGPHTRSDDTYHGSPYNLPEAAADGRLGRQAQLPLSLLSPGGQSDLSALLLPHEVTAAVQRCGATPPEQCSCHESSMENEREAPAVQRKCVETPDGTKRWKYEYDGCSLPANLAIGLGSLTLGGAAKDNPAGGENTAFALSKPTTEGGVACDRHDECYQSCATKKEECDQRMYADMKAICASAPASFRQRCEVAAVAYYNGLKRLPQAQAAFDDRKKHVCACDPQQLPPSQRFPPRELLRSPRTGLYLGWLDYQLILPRLAGYRVFSNAEEYEAYVHPQPNPRAPEPTKGNVPSSLRMR